VLLIHEFGLISSSRHYYRTATAHACTAAERKTGKGVCQCCQVRGNCPEPFVGTNSNISLSSPAPTGAKHDKLALPTTFSFVHLAITWWCDADVFMPRRISMRPFLYCSLPTFLPPFLFLLSFLTQQEQNVSTAAIARQKNLSWPQKKPGAAHSSGMRARLLLSVSGMANAQSCHCCYCLPLAYIYSYTGQLYLARVLDLQPLRPHPISKVLKAGIW
jgi:hypothetical protein